MPQPGAVKVILMPLAHRQGVDPLADQFDSLITDAVLAARPISTVISTRRTGPAKVMGDPIRVRQVIRNLVTNADRYGGDHVLIETEMSEEQYAIRVIDNGPGIPESHRAKIFEPYYRAHSMSGRTESVGLGLTVSTKLAELMEGSLSYDYVDGHSIFELSLPKA